MTAHITQADCVKYLREAPEPKQIDLTFLDPPFNQAKDYAHHDDDMPLETYWAWMQTVCELTQERTSEGGAVYFMQREKNAEFVLRCLRESGWTLQNLIVWKKLTSAVPSSIRYGKAYQIIVFATKGDKPRVFNKLRITPPLPANYKYDRKNGMYVTDVWDDIRELTSGYFAGDEALRNQQGERLHKQQAPIALLLRIILSSTMPGDTVFDPFAGTGTTLIAAHQAGRIGYGVEIDAANVRAIETRLHQLNSADQIEKYRDDYRHTDELSAIWGSDTQGSSDALDLPLFRQSGE
jgi:DNA modification methylase